MSFTNVKRGDSDLEVLFDLSGVNAATANALRRSLYAYIKTYAICASTFIKNDNKALTDDYLAHRLTLVPLNFNFLADLDEKELPLPTLTLDKTNTSERDSMRVYLSDFEAEGTELSKVVVYPDTLFAILEPGQSLAVKSEISTGTQKEYASIFSPVCCAAYEIVEGKKSKAAAKSKASEIFKYQVEAIGQIPVVECVSSALSVLQEHFQEVLVALETIDPLILEIENLSTDNNEYSMPKEDYSIGNLLTTYLQEELNLTAAYETGHPLTPTLKIRLLDTPNNEQVFKQALQTMIDRIADLQQKWETASKSLTAVKPKKVSKPKPKTKTV